MDEILERLLTDATAAFGSRRIVELKPFLEETASDLDQLLEYGLDPSDGI